LTGALSPSRRSIGTASRLQRQAVACAGGGFGPPRRPLSRL